jgi:Zn-dependent peptidase ImmA (M78 family)
VLPAAFDLPSNGAIIDTPRDLVMHPGASDRPRSIIERQAHRLAAAILVPRRTLPRAVAELQRGMGITRKVGNVCYNRQPQSARDYDKIIAFLSALYSVSLPVMRYRLAELGFTEEFSPTGFASKLGDVLRQALRDLFKD